MTRKKLLWLAPALLAVGCMNKAATKAADDATAQFYQEVAAKQYQAIYDGASTDLRNATAGADFVAMMQRLDANMGACGPPTKRMNIHVNINNGTTFRTQGYTRKCANGPLNESVTIVIRGGEAKLAGYHFGDAADAESSND